MQINLLPWREELKKEKQIRLGVIVASGFILGIITMLMLHIYFKSVLQEHTSRLTFLQSKLSQKQTELTDLNEKKKEKAILIQQLNFIFNLRETSFKAVDLLNKIPRIIPQTVVLEKLMREGNTLTFVGRAQSNLQITLFMKNSACFRK